MVTKASLPGLTRQSIPSGEFCEERWMPGSGPDMTTTAT
jgi:hypothetical protein